MQNNNQVEKLATEMESILETPFWVFLSTSVLDFVGLFLVCVGVIYIFIRSNAPGTKIMFFGLLLYLSTFLIVLLISATVEEIGAAYIKIIWISELIGSISLFICGYGLLRYSLSLKKYES